jgi:hypothetical protein
MANTCDTCDMNGDEPQGAILEIIDPIYGLSHGFICEGCNERNADRQADDDASGENIAASRERERQTLIDAGRVRP